MKKFHFVFFEGPLIFYTQEEINRRINTASNEIGEVFLEHHDNDWDLTHRYVEESYRNQGFGSALIRLAETFVQEQAEMKKLPQKITLNAGQPSVLQMFHSKGYYPQSEKDKQLFQKISDNNRCFELHYAHFRPHNQDGSFASEWISHVDKDFYCFEPGIFPKSEQNAVRINLEKCFVPQSKHVSVQEKVNSMREEANVQLQSIGG